MVCTISSSPRRDSRQLPNPVKDIKLMTVNAGETNKVVVILDKVPSTAGLALERLAAPPSPSTRWHLTRLRIRPYLAEFTRQSKLVFAFDLRSSH